MAVNVRRVRATPERVFGILADGWLYSGWVVGASRVRGVPDDWPHRGSRLAHSFGPWPFVIDDETPSLVWDPPRRLVMQPKGWPLGEARVQIDVRPAAGGCLVRLEERPVHGPGSWLPSPLVEVPLWIRNRETLRRLALMAESGARPPWREHAGERRPA